MSIRGGYNCGMKELYGLNPDPTRPLASFMDWHQNEDGREFNLIYFSDHVENSRAEALAKYIQENDFGTVIESQRVNNPVHEHLIHAYFWHPNYTRLAEWYKGYRVEEKKKGIWTTTPQSLVGWTQLPSETITIPEPTTYEGMFSVTPTPARSQRNPKKPAFAKFKDHSWKKPWRKT